MLVGGIDQAKVRDLLVQARRKIERPGTWSVCTAVDKDGRYVVCRSPEAVAWSPSGAIYSLSLDVPLCDAADDFLDDLVLHLVRTGEIVDFPAIASISLWNDARGRTQEQVLRLIDQAIKLLA